MGGFARLLRPGAGRLVLLAWIAALAGGGCRDRPPEPGAAAAEGRAAAPRAEAAAAGAGAIDWSRHADVDTVRVVTTREDGALRETTVWLAVSDGDAYIRTGNTRWGADVARDPDIALRIGEVELPVRAVFIEGEAEQQRVHAAFRAKYGVWDRLVSLMPSAGVKVMRLEPRPAAPADGRSDRGSG